MIEYLAATALAVAWIGTVQAIPIVGSLGFTGTYSQNGGTTGDLSTANNFAIGPTIAVDATTTTGAFVGAGAPLSYASPIGVNGHGPPIGQLWSVTVGSIVYTMTVSTESQTFTSAAQLNLAGTGTISDGNPADNTPGTWQLGFGVSGTPPNVSFTWQSTSANTNSGAVPDGGNTLLLLGAVLSGIALLRWKLA